MSLIVTGSISLDSTFKTPHHHWINFPRSCNWACTVHWRTLVAVAERFLEVVCSLTLSPTALGHIWPRLFIGNFSKCPYMWLVPYSSCLSTKPFRLFYNIRNLNIWPNLTAISFQSQNLCHNKSTQHMDPQRSELASREGGWLIGLITNRVFQINIFYWSRLFPYHPNIVFC